MTLASEEIARLTWPATDGALVLGKDLLFRADGPDADLLIGPEAIANVLAADFPRGPSEGTPGHALAHAVANRMGAELELSPVPPADPDAIY